MDEAARFPAFIAVSVLVLMGVLRFALRERTSAPWGRILVTAAIVVVGGMPFAKYGQNAGWPWWIYYTVPALVTLTLPPLLLRMSLREFGTYVILAFLSSPAIHVAFSFFLGWKSYMPFIEVPAFWELF